MNTCRIEICLSVNMKQEIFVCIVSFRQVNEKGDLKDLWFSDKTYRHHYAISSEPKPTDFINYLLTDMFWS